MFRPTPQPELTTRFAPSPTGYLHKGHAYSAYLNYLHACSAGGHLVLRIEDLDGSRCRPEYETAALEDLSWLGIRWQGAPMRQSARAHVYAGHLAQLAARGLIYRCFEPASDIAEAANAPHGSPKSAFAGAALAALEERDNLALGRSFVWRLSLDAVIEELGDDYESLTFFEDTSAGLVTTPAEPWRFGDVVLGRRDTGSSYHLSSVVDDATQGITHVIRGEELREAAGLHVLLYRLFGWDAPIFGHHKMVTDVHGRRLSKRDDSASLRSIRAAGTSPAELLADLGCFSRAEWPGGTERARTGRWLPARRPREPPLRPALRFDP